MTVSLPWYAAAGTRRDYAVAVGRILLEDGGSAGWSWEDNGCLKEHGDSLVRAAAERLGVTGRSYTPNGVATVLCDLLDLHGAAYSVAERLRISKWEDAKPQASDS